MFYLLSKYYGVEGLPTTSGIMVILVIQARDDEGRKGKKERMANTN